MEDIEGTVKSGFGHFGPRMTKYADVFESATGERLHPGTINVEVKCEIPINEEFRIKGRDLGEPDQDLLFERCKINGIDAYRIRPYHLATGMGGHGDHILEITSANFVAECEDGSQVIVTLLREL